jgi:hypothetical protein
VEVAVYPKPGHDVDLHLLDFELKRESGQKSMAQGGSAWDSGANPNTGRPDHAWGTYAGEGTGYAPPMYGSGPSAHSLEAKVRSLASPQGRTNRAIAGYIYFPVPPQSKPRQSKDDVPEIWYLLPGGGSVTLRLQR